MIELLSLSPKLTFSKYYTPKRILFIETSKFNMSAKMKRKLKYIGLELSLGEPQTPQLLPNNNDSANVGRQRQPPPSQTTFSGPNGRISSDFERNKFIVSPDQPPITTDLQPEDVFEELGSLGTGSSGNVLKMRHKPTGEICAVKQMRRTINEEQNKRIYMDLEVVLECECDNIVRCCGYFIKEAEVWICMELMTTCFDKLLKARKKPLPEKFLGALANAAVAALHYLKEEKGIIHRDVKPSNILINDLGQIKLCDFGISGRLVDSMAKTRTGCLPYMAPERIEQPSYDVSSDVWSLGITLFELATGRSPYADCQTEFQILTKVVGDEAPTLPADIDFSPEFRDFISSCLTKNHKKRPKYRQLLQHKFIEKHKETVVNLSELDSSSCASSEDI